MAIVSNYRSGASGLVDPTDASSYTFAAADVGPEASDRYVLVSVNGRAATTRTITGVTIGGVSATIVGSQIDNVGSSSAFFIAPFPTGTTANIVVSLNLNWLRCQIGVYALTGVGSAVAYDAQSDTTFSAGVVSVSMNCPAGGAIYALANGFNSGNTGWGSWAGVVEDFDGVAEGAAAHGAGAHTDYASAQTARTVSATTTGGSPGTAPVFAAIALGPSSAGNAAGTSAALAVSSALAEAAGQSIGFSTAAAVGDAAAGAVYRPSPRSLHVLHHVYR